MREERGEQCVRRERPRMRSSLIYGATCPGRISPRREISFSNLTLSARPRAPLPGGLARARRDLHTLPHTNVYIYAVIRPPALLIPKYHARYTCAALQHRT